jgi:hypothetical protein
MRGAIAMSATLLALAVGCSSPSTVDHATLGDLGFFVPSGWTSRSLSSPHRHAVEWQPIDNDAKQTVTVWRTTPREAFKSNDLSRIARLLAEAQSSLASGTFSPTRTIMTQRGLRGVRIEGEFVPPGKQQPYRRAHAVLLDRGSLVHVVFTAAEGDDRAFEVVLESLHRGGAS